MSTTTTTTDSPMGRPGIHESAWGHVEGSARYVDDLPMPPGTLVCRFVTSPHARARIVSIDATTARGMPGVHAVLFREDVPGDNLIGPIVHDEPLLAGEEVFYQGQVVGLVVGETYEACHAAEATVDVVYEPLDDAIFTVPEALERQSFSTVNHVIERGDVKTALQRAQVRFQGVCASGAQDHFYLETHASLAVPGEAGTMHVYASSQHPTETQKLVAVVLGLSSKDVICEVPRMGGAFGGKESQASNFACLAALGAQYTGRPVKVWLDRDSDMVITGKRHPFWSRYDAGFDGHGRLIAFDVQCYANGGWSIDLSGPVHDRALFHLDNAYFIEHLRFAGRACRTNLPSNTAFRGFGGPQGMLVVEDALNRFAERMGMDPAEVRALNFYGEAPRDRAPYGQQIPSPRCERVWAELRDESDYDRRRAAIEHFNERSPHLKRGLGFQPVKFGISFTKAVLNQAGALVLVYTDGSVQLNHGGTEMGQGLHTKMLRVCAEGLGVEVDRIRPMNTATDKVPNTSATAASSGSDLNGQAVAHACEQIRERMAPKAAELLGLDPEDPADVASARFAGGTITSDRAPGASSTFGAVATACWLAQIPLSATGYYCTPGVAYDQDKGQGTPFYYFAYGGAVVEVEVNGLTGEHRMLRADILHDVGASLVPSIDIGQIEGAFVQGVGWLTMEELLFSEEGRLLTPGPSTYKIPAVGDVPADFRVRLLERAAQDGVIGGSKAVGEPPFMLGIAVVTALRHAIAAYGHDIGAHAIEVELALPATPEAILRAIENQKQRAREMQAAAPVRVAAAPLRA